MEVRRKAGVIRGVGVSLFVLVWSLLLFVPFPGAFAVDRGERFLCVWSDGAETEESYYSAYRDMEGMDDGGTIVLKRDGRTGRIEAGESCLAAVSVFEEGNLGELLALDISGVTRLERAALYRRYHSRLWYADEYFAWTGEKITPATACAADEFVLLAGEMTSTRLKETGARTLYLRAEAAVTASVLAETSVERVVAEPPYTVEGNALCLSTAGGVRLLAGLPAAKRVTVPDGVRFADEGALLPCAAVEEVTVPFAGNAASPSGSLFKGEFAHLFSTGKAYRVPETLKKVRVKGGYLISHAFYACGGLTEIDACGVSPQSIERDAFLDCPNLLLLHTPRADVTLLGNFTKRLAPCGCTIYERAG